MGQNYWTVFCFVDALELKFLAKSTKLQQMRLFSPSSSSKLKPLQLKILLLRKFYRCVKIKKRSIDEEFLCSLQKFHVTSYLCRFFYDESRQWQKYIRWSLDFPQILKSRKGYRFLRIKMISWWKLASVINYLCDNLAIDSTSRK